MTVLITGAGGGLGRAMALEAARRGYDLMLTDVNASSLDIFRDGLLRQYDVKVDSMPCDLTDAAEVKKMFDGIREKNIALNMLLHVAGIDFEGGFLELECDRLIDIVRVNIEGTLRVLHGALLRRDTSKRFTIVVVSSLASLYPMPLKATYAASKRFLLDFSMALSQELTDKNATVLALCPGGLPTTPGALQGISAQGFWGRITTNSLPLVARRTISRALLGKRIYIPGAVNRIFSILGRLVPRTALTKLLYSRWRQAREGHAVS
jgi:short-subunit dehydrogenase